MSYGYEKVVLCNNNAEKRITGRARLDKAAWTVVTGTQGIYLKEERQNNLGLLTSLRNLVYWFNIYSSMQYCNFNVCDNKCAVCVCEIHFLTEV